MSVGNLSNHRHGALVFLVLTLVAILSACDARTSVRGTVVDADGKAIGDAEVRLVSLKSGRTDVTYTDENGAFVCGITHGPAAGKFQFSVSKPGYGTYRKEINEKAAISEKIVLTRDSEVVRQKQD